MITKLRPQSGMALTLILSLMLFAACQTAYKATPLPFKAPSAHSNYTVVAGLELGSRAFADEKEAAGIFGFNILKAGMLPVEVVFSNTGSSRFEVNAAQTFLEDEQGNLWPLLPNHLAYERATQWSQAQAVTKTGAKGGIYGAAAGALIGAAVGIVTGEDVAASVGKGAAVGGAAGATLGGAAGMDGSTARREIMRDLTDKSLENKQLPANGLAFGILFFPAEAQSAAKLHLRILDTETKQEYSVQMAFEPPIREEGGQKEQ